MKKICLFLFSFAVCTSCFATLTDADKLSSLCRVWGFLKYYHPAVAKGKIDWDKEFMDRVGPVTAARDKEELNNIYISWIASLGEVRKLKQPVSHVKDTSDKNYDNAWMDDRSVFSDSLSSMLHYIERNKAGRRNYYIRRHFPQMQPSFRNEKKHKDSVMPSANMRLLTLARYWNIVQYYYPYKFITDTPWNRVLDRMVPVFANATDTVPYIRAMKVLVAHINDSHGILTVPKDVFTGTSGMAKTIPAVYRIIGDRAIVELILDDSMAQLDDIRCGDVILGVDGKSVTDIVAGEAKYISASNEPTMLRRMSYMHRLTFGYTDTVRITFERDGKIFEKTVRRYYVPQMHYRLTKKEEKPVYKPLDANIGYINLAPLRRKHIKGVMRKARHNDALILDVRAYPNMTMYKLARYLNGGRKKFARFVMPVWRYPGHFNNKAKSSCGRSWRKGYKGKVILLMNETTQSHAEFTCMALQQGPRVTCIGSQTAGADGDVATFYLPGGYQTQITGLGVYYPDGRPTQRIGIVPDIEVKPTIEGIRARKDEVLERAILFAKTGK